MKKHQTKKAPKPKLTSMPSLLQTIEHAVSFGSHLEGTICVAVDGPKQTHWWRAELGADVTTKLGRGTLPNADATLHMREQPNDPWGDIVSMLGDKQLIMDFLVHYMSSGGARAIT